MCFVAILSLTEAVCPAQQYDPRGDLRAFDPKSWQDRKQLKTQRDELRKLLREREAKARPSGCSKQILREVEWLLSSTAQVDRARARLRDLRESLADPEHSQALAQSPDDGSWGTCHEEWFLKLDASVDALIRLNATGRRPEHHLTLLDRINSPQRLTAYLDSILVSDVRATGIDHRKELNMSVPALVRLVPGTVTSGYAFHPDLERTLWEYLDNKWQNPATGYWGAWYRRDGTIVKTDDLSITFHIVSYRQGRVRRLDRIVATTLAIQNREYPFGWLEEGRPSIHHDYDVVVLLRHGWPHATAEQRKSAADAIDRMLTRCLRETLRADGTFDEHGSGGRAEAFYFGVSFLDEIGYFDPKRRFWTDREFPDAQAVRLRLMAAVPRLDPTDSHTLFAAAKLAR